MSTNEIWNKHFVNNILVKMTTSINFIGSKIHTFKVKIEYSQNLFKLIYNLNKS